jgi:hypothetical protein
MAQAETIAGRSSTQIRERAGPDDKCSAKPDGTGDRSSMKP